MKIDKIDKIESVILCKLSKEIIGELTTSCVTSLKKTIDEVPMMTLKINKYFISQNNKEKKYNPLYDEIKVKRYLFINNEDYYLIEGISEKDENMLFGYTDTMKLVNIKGNKENIGKITC